MHRARGQPEPSAVIDWGLVALVVLVLAGWFSRRD
jgi:hypothetical protein